MDKDLEDIKRRAGINETHGRELQDFMFRIAGGDIGREEAIEQIVKMAGNNPAKVVDIMLSLMDAAGSFSGMTYKLRMGLSKERY